MPLIYSPAFTHKATAVCVSIGTSVIVCVNPYCHVFRLLMRYPWCKSRSLYSNRPPPPELASSPGYPRTDTHTHTHAHTCIYRDG